MSSILEALERAEKERNPVEKRSFIDSDLSNPGVLQRHWVWIIAGVTAHQSVHLGVGDDESRPINR